MKKKHGLFLGFAVLLLAAIFTLGLAGCPSDDGGDDSSGGYAVTLKNTTGSAVEFKIEPVEGSGGRYTINETLAKSVPANGTGEVKVTLSEEGNAAGRYYAKVSVGTTTSETEVIGNIKGIDGTWESYTVTYDGSAIKGSAN